RVLFLINFTVFLTVVCFFCGSRVLDTFFIPFHYIKNTRTDVLQELRDYRSRILTTPSCGHPSKGWENDGVLNSGNGLQYKFSIQCLWNCCSTTPILL
uniref:hypothetical protein n=1 Tax=Flavobacterium sp. TaxID=239 RepID=UPI0040476972